MLATVRWIGLIALCSVAVRAVRAEGSPTDGHSAIPETALAELRAQMVAPDDLKVEDVQKISRYHAILRDGRELERQHPDAANLYIVRSAMLEAMRGLVQTQADDIKPDDVLNLARKIMESTDQPAWKIGADTILTQVEILKLSGDEPPQPKQPAESNRIDSPVAKILKAYVDRYCGTEVHPDALIEATTMAQQTGETKLVLDFGDQMENAFGDEPRVNKFLRERLQRGASRNRQSLVADLPLLDGSRLHLPHDLLGKVVLIHFWSPRIPRCMEALDALKATYQEYHRRGLEIVSVCVDRDREKLEEVIKARSLPWPQVFSGKGDDDPLVQLYQIKLLPSYWLVGPTGQIIEDRFGHMGGLDLFASILSTLTGSWRKVAWLQACRSGEFLLNAILEQLPPDSMVSSKPASPYGALAGKLREAQLAWPMEQKAHLMQEVLRLAHVAELAAPNAVEQGAVRNFGLIAAQWLAIQQNDSGMDAEANGFAQSLLNSQALLPQRVLADYITTRAELLRRNSEQKQNIDHRQDAAPIDEFKARYDKSEAAWMAYPLALALTWETGQRPKVINDIRVAMCAPVVRDHPEIRATLRNFFGERYERNEPFTMALTRTDGSALHLPDDCAGKVVVLHFFSAAAIPGAPWTAVSLEARAGCFVRDRQMHRTEQVSVSGWDTHPSLSPDGRYVSFSSRENGLDPQLKKDNASGVFLFDRKMGDTVELSLNKSGIHGVGLCEAPVLSQDARFAAFWSNAENLVSDDANKQPDVFLCDREANKIERISVLTDGTEANGPSLNPCITGDGRYIAFQTQAQNLGDKEWTIMVRDRQTSRTIRIAAGVSPTIATASHDAPTLAFRSVSGKLVSQDTNNCDDIFVCESLDKIERVSVASDGAEANGPSVNPAISADGRFVAFSSKASNLAKDDTNNKADIFVFDRKTRKTERVSVGSNGEEANGDSFCCAISADGRYVAFDSAATNLVSGGNSPRGVFVHDRQTHQTERISESSTGSPGNRESKLGSISADGRYVSFDSQSTNLGPGRKMVSGYGVLQPRPNLDIVAVNLDSAPEPAEQLAREHSDWIVAHAGPEAANAIVRRLGICALPATWVVGPSGRAFLTDTDLDLMQALVSACGLSRNLVEHPATNLDQWNQAYDQLLWSQDGCEIAQALHYKFEGSENWNKDLDHAYDLMVRTGFKFQDEQVRALKLNLNQITAGASGWEPPEIVRTANGNIAAILATKKKIVDLVARRVAMKPEADLSQLKRVKLEADCVRVPKSAEREKDRKQLSLFFQEVPMPADIPPTEAEYWLFRVKPL